MNWKDVYIRIRNKHVVYVRFPKNKEEEYELSLAFRDNLFTMHAMLIEGNPYDGGTETGLLSFSSGDYNEFVFEVEERYPQVKGMISQS